MIFILLMTSNSVGDNNANFCLSNQYVFVMMYFGKLSPLTVVELNILHVHIWKSSAALRVTSGVTSEAKLCFLRVKKIYKKCINKLLLGEKRQICLSTALQ